MGLKRETELHKPLTLAVTVVAYILWLWIYLWCEDRWIVTPAEITAVSLLGTVMVAAYALLWWKWLGSLLTPYHLFLAFFAAFHFGQCILWAFGIHTNREIGQKLVFSTLSADAPLILRGQLIYLICLVTFNSGALLVFSRKKHCSPQIGGSGEDPRWQYLYQTALLLSLVVIPVTLYRAVTKLMLALQFGYSSLYYGTAAEILSNPVLEILTTLFFPCLLGLLLGSRFRKNVRLTVYLVFGFFAVVTLLAGDRGEWINLLLFLFWAEHACHRSFKSLGLLVTAVAGLGLLTVVDAIVSLRNTGLTWDGFTAALLSKDSNLIVSLLTEFGHSMGISLLLLASPINCPYGNTYWMSIPTVFGTGLANRLFGMEYVQLHTWFPKYLGISYGTDFSMIGEAMLNCGVYAAPLVLLLEGMIIGRIAQTPYRQGRNPLGLCLSISVMVYTVRLARSTVWLVLSQAVWMLIAFPLVYWVVKSLAPKEK